MLIAQPTPRMQVMSVAVKSRTRPTCEKYTSAGASPECEGERKRMSRQLLPWRPSGEKKKSQGGRTCSLQHPSTSAPAEASRSRP